VFNRMFKTRINVIETGTIGKVRLEILIKVEVNESIVLWAANK